MQTQGAAQSGGGVGTIPRRGGRWLEALLTVAAILVIVALMALMTRGMVAPADTDTGIMHASMVEDIGQMRGTGAAVIHDDAGNVR